jgi:hypothetical protein
MLLLKLGWVKELNLCTKDRLIQKTPEGKIFVENVVKHGS